MEDNSSLPLLLAKCYANDCYYLSAIRSMETETIWHNGKFVPWADAKIHVLTHSLHYGGGVFEGIRFYQTEKGPAIFRLREHLQRLFYSAECLKMEIPYSVSELADATIELVRQNKIQHGYIRPIAFSGYGKMGVNPRGVPIELAIACWPWGAYLSEGSIDIQVSKYIRIHPQTTVADAKITGHYVNGILAIHELSGTRYHEALFLDYKGSIAEGPGENFFIVKNGVVYTPPLGTILAGITRATIMELLRHQGHEVIEKDLSLEDAFDADEAFFTGTAAEVTPIKTINDRELRKSSDPKFSNALKAAYLDVVNGRNPHFEHYLTYTNG